MPTQSSVPSVRPSHALLVSAAACMAACATSPDRPGNAHGPAPDLGGSVFVLQSEGLDALLSDPRDAGLRRALALLPERLNELPEDLGQAAPPPGAIELLCEALGAPWTLRVGLDGEGEVPIRATLVVRPSEPGAAARLAERVAGLSNLFGFPRMSTDDHPGLTEVETPGGTLLHGTAEEGHAFVIAWGAPDVRPFDGESPLPRGMQPTLAVGFDMGAMTQLIGRMLPPHDEEAEEVRRMLAFAGLGGDADVRFTLVGGLGEKGSFSVMRYEGWRTLAEATGALAQGPLSAADLALVPGDASLVYLVRAEPVLFLRYLDVLGPEADHLVDELEETLGIALGPDLLEPLGATFGFYLSDSTGGGGLASAVLLAAVDDEPRMSATLETLSAQLHGFSLEEADGRLRVRDFEHRGVRGYELDFPGLPVPLSPCLALARGHLFLAATPQALAAALDAAGDGPARHSSWIERVASADLGSLDDLQSLLYLDAPRFARGGYGATNALGAMLANGVRSPSDPAREAGWVWPPYRELLAGARPTVSLARIRGDDLVTLTGADRAATLQLAAFSGLGRELLSGLLMVSTLAAVVTPALTARLYAGSEVDEHVATAQGDLYQLFGAIESYVEERDGLYPQSLEDLLEPAADGVPWYDEIPRDPWGNDYIYVVDEEGAHVLSYGSDGVPGGEGDARDLTSDEVLEAWGELDGEHEHDEGQWEDEAGREGEFEGEGGDAEPEDEGDLLRDFAELSQSVTTVQGDVNLAAGGDPKAARRVRHTMRAVKAMALEVRREARVLAAAAADEGDGR